MNQKNRFQKMLLTTGLLALAQILTACSDTTSDNIKTSGLYSNYSVTNNTGSRAGTVHCQAVFHVGGSTGTYVILNSGDSVTCNGQGMSYSKDPILNQVVYSLDVPATADGNYNIVLSRPNEGPYASSVRLPAGIQPLAPTINTNIHKGTAFNVQWVANTTSSSSMSISLSYYYQENGETVQAIAYAPTSQPESGSAWFTSSDTAGNPSATGTWPATLTLSRTNFGSMASGLNGGISASQSVNVNVNLVD